MQSLESSCQEADTIINDTLLKLKGSSLAHSSSNAFRQPLLQQTQSHNQYQSYNQPQQSLQQQSHHSFLQQTASSLSGLQPLSHQPPPYLFDGPESPPDYLLAEHGLLSSTNTMGVDTRQQMSSLSTPSLLSNINSIISPPPVVPDMLLNTSPTSPTATLNCLKQEKRSLLSPLSSTDCSRVIEQCNASSPSKKPKLTNSLTFGDGMIATSSNTASILQPLLSSSSSISNNSNNVKYSTSPVPSTSMYATNLMQLKQQNSISEHKYNPIDQNKPAKVVFSTPINSTLVNQTKLSSNVGSDCSTVGSIIGGSSPAVQPITPITSPLSNTAPSISPLPQKSHTSYSSQQAGTSSASSPTISSIPTASGNAYSNAFFDINDKIRELYLYLLIHDEKGLKESRRKHRTRSFILERLVEREKLNTVVVNLYPGNKGYSLAFYQDDNQMEALNETTTSTIGDIISGGSGVGISAGSGTTFDSGGGGGAGVSCLISNIGSPILSGSKHGTSGGSSSRLKQTQISSNSLNNRNSNNLISSKNNDTVDLDTLTSSSLKSTANMLDNYGLMDDGTVSYADCTASTSATSTDNQTDRDEDENLVEVMSWPYEIDDLLNSIDKEELPIFISDLLETRIPNVFYSGCVICQVRDYRQTFPISSNSCDIYHVLLKPTNEMLYSDINQLSIDAGISSEDKLALESQLILATSEPLCLDPDPKIGRHAINSQHRKQMWNTSPLRRQMKKYSQISINRKRKIDQFTHHYGLELCDYLQRLRQRPRALSSLASGSSDASRSVASINTGTNMLPSINKIQKKSSDVVRPIRAPKFEYPPLIEPVNVDVLKLAKEYAQKGRETKEDFLPVLVEEYTLESDREYGHVYLIKLSIYKRPATMEYLGELYVDRNLMKAYLRPTHSRIHRQGGEQKGESCRFSLGTRAYADRYIDQFTELFTEEGRKAVRITHRVPGQPANISCTNGYNYQAQSNQPQSQQQQSVEPSTSQTKAPVQLQHQQQHSHLAAIASTSQQQPVTVQHQPTIPQNFVSNQIITPTLNATSPSQLPGNQQLNINVQGGNIVGIASTSNVQQIRQSAHQIFDASSSAVNVQTQQGQQISLTNGSLVLVQQQPSGSGCPTALTIQTATNNQQKTQMVTNSNQIAIAGSSMRTQMGANVPILQAQLKAGPVVSGQHQQQLIQQKVTTVNQSTNPNANAYVTGFMNVSNAFQQPQQQTQMQVQQHASQQKSANNAAILSLLNSAPAAMTSTPISSPFNPATVQQGSTIAQTTQQQQHHQTITTEQLLQQTPRKTNEVIQNLLSNNLRKINMANSGNQTMATQNRGTNLIAVGLPTDGSTSQSVRVTMSALASQLASPPALMTNSNFGFTTGAASNNNNVTLSNNNIKILNNSSQRIISASSLRRDSLATAAPSPGSDSNASNTSGASNLGFAMPGLNALLATSPSSGSDQSQITSHGNVVMASSGGSVGNVAASLTNQALFERLNSNSGTNANNSILSPQQGANITKNIVQNVANVQSPAASVSPLSSPPPQPSPQQVQVQQTGQTTTLNLQGIDFQSLQGAMATFPGLQNVQVQIPISLPLANAPLASGTGNVSGNAQRATQQATSLLVSVPVTSTTQVNNMQTVPGGCGTIVSAVPASGAATQTVVLTNTGNTGNPQAGSMLSLPIAQLFASVKGLNPQTLRTATVSSGTSNNVINANIIQAPNANGSINNPGGSNIPGAVNISNSTGTTSIQLVGTLQQRPRSIQVLGTKQITNRGQLAQRNLPNASPKLAAATPTGATQIPTTANLTATPLVMTTQKLQLKLQKQNAANMQPQQQHQQQVQSSHHSQQQQQQLSNQQTQQSQHIQIAGTTLAQSLNAAAIAAANQKRRRSATDVNK